MVTTKPTTVEEFEQLPWSYVSDKLEIYLAAGVPLIWVIDPERRQIIVRRPGREERRLGTEHNLDGEEVLPGFGASVADVLRG